MNITFLFIVTVSLLIQAKSIASETVSLDAHVHGLSEMTIAIDKHALEIEIISPAINVVGFEHIAKTKENIARVKNAESQLKRYNAMFSFTGGNCKLLNQNIDVSSIINIDSNTEHKHEHKHKHVKPQQVNNNHSEIIASYSYYCEKTLNLSTITVTVFDLFPGIEKIHTMWISEMQQGAITLHTKNRILNLK